MRVLLRSKSGCFRCRKRRKKCDELKPICTACRRLGYTCNWRDGSGNSTASSKRRVDPSLIPQGVTGHGFPGFRDQAQLKFLVDFGGVFQQMICPVAGHQFDNVGRIFVIALEEAWTRDALVAFTSYMQFAGTRDRKLENQALSSYQMAVIGMKHRLGFEVRDEQKLQIIVTAVFLGGLELLGTGNPRLAIGHFALVAQLGQSLFARVCSDETVLSLYRICLEGVAYNLACNSLFHSVPDTVLRSISWTDYNRIFRQPPGSAAPDYQLSPHFGGNHEFYQLILEATSFSRQSYSQDMRTRQGQRWLKHIDYLEQRLTTYYVNVPAAVATLYTAKYQLYAIALRIFCLKVKDHHLQAQHPTIAGEVSQAQQICTRTGLSETHNPTLTWPLIILLCACSDRISFRFFANQVEKIKSNFGLGQLRNIEAVMSSLGRGFAAQARRREPEIQDNLWVLLCREGVTAAYVHPPDPLS